MTTCHDPDREAPNLLASLARLGDLYGQMGERASLERLEDEDWFVRLAAVVALGQLGVKEERIFRVLFERLQDEERVIQALVEKVWDQNPAVHHFAIRGLARLGVRVEMERLAAALVKKLREKKNEKLASAIAKAVGLPEEKEAASRGVEAIS